MLCAGSSSSLSLARAGEKAGNLIHLEMVKWQRKDALTPGKHTVEFDWKYDGPGMGKGRHRHAQGGRQDRG
jgi:hypothetical protein